MASAPPLTRLQHWQRTRKLTAGLLAAWLLLTLAVALLARPLAQVTVFGWPLSFYLAAQGVVLGYVAIAGFYVWRMGKLDQLCDDRPEDQHGA